MVNNIVLVYLSYWPVEATIFLGIGLSDLGILFRPCFIVAGKRIAAAFFIFVRSCASAGVAARGLGVVARSGGYSLDSL